MIENDYSIPLKATRYSYSGELVMAIPCKGERKVTTLASLEMSVEHVPKRPPPSWYIGLKRDRLLPSTITFDKDHLGDLIRRRFCEAKLYKEETVLLEQSLYVQIYILFKKAEQTK